MVHQKGATLGKPRFRPFPWFGFALPGRPSAVGVRPLMRVSAAYPQLSDYRQRLWFVSPFIFLGPAGVVHQKWGYLWEGVLSQAPPFSAISLGFCSAALPVGRGC